MGTPLADNTFVTIIGPGANQTALVTVTGLTDDGSGTAHVCLSRAVSDNAGGLYNWFRSRDQRNVSIAVGGVVSVVITNAVPEKYCLSGLDSGSNKQWTESLYICGTITVQF